MAINVNENGTIKEIGTKISGFTIDEVDLLWDSYLVNRGHPATLSQLEKYRFLIFLGADPEQGRNYSDVFIESCIIDMNIIRQCSCVYDSTRTLELGVSNPHGAHTYAKLTKTDSAESLNFHIYGSDTWLVTAFGIACSTTE